MIKHILSVTSVFIIGSLNLFSQTKFPFPVSEHNYTKLSNVYDIQSDHLHFLWFASERGLCRYDGMQFKYYHNSQMSTKAGTNLQFDKWGRVWYSNFDGEIYFVTQDSLTRYNIPNNEALDFKVQGDKLWVSHSGFIHRYSIENGHAEKVLSVPPNVMVRFFNENIFFLSEKNNHIDIYDLKGHFIHSFEFNYRTVSKIFNYNQSFHTVRSQESGLEVYNLNQSTERPEFVIPYISSITHLVHQDSLFLICTKDGMVQYNLTTQAWNVITTDNNVLSCHQDRYGNVWVGTNHGLIKYSTHPITSITHLAKGEYKFLPVNNGLLMSNEKGTIYNINATSHTVDSIYQSKESQRIYTLTPINNNFIKSLLFQMYRSREGNTFKFQSQEYAVMRSGIKDVEILDEKYMAVALSGSCELLVYDTTYSLTSPWDALFQNSLITLSEPYALHFQLQLRAKDVAVDKINQRLLYATNLGLKLITSEGQKTIIFNNSNIYADRIVEHEGLFYINTHQGELFILNANNVLIPLMALSRHLPINRILKLGDHLVFCNTNAIYSIDFKSLNIGTELHQCQRFYSPVPVDEIEDLNIRDSVMSIIYNNQLIQLDLIPFDTQHPGFEFYWQYIKTNKGFHWFQSDIEIEPSETYTDIHFSIIDFNHMVYSIEYRLNEDEWKNVNMGARSINFSSISPGDYTLKLRINGIVQDEVIHFEKLKPWYQQVWFFILIFLALTALVVAFFQFKNTSSIKS